MANKRSNVRLGYYFFCITDKTAYHDLGSGDSHLGAAYIIIIAPTNIAAQRSQNVMNKNQRRRTQNGSFAYLISSSFPIPTKAALISPKSPSIQSVEKHEKSKLTYQCRV